LATPINDLTYHHAFALFQIYAAIINIPICIFLAGGTTRITAILDQTSPSSIVLVILFSIIWGIGTLLFGLACKVAGVGLGTNLSVGIVAVLGTLLPLIIEQTLISAAGAVILTGLTLCCTGLWQATEALAARDHDEDQEKEKQIQIDSDNETNTSYQVASVLGSIPEIIGRKENDDENISYAKTLSFADQWKDDAGGDTDISLFADADDKGNVLDIDHFGSCAEFSLTTDANTLESKKQTLSPPSRKLVGQTLILTGKYSTWQKVGICVATGIFATQLQFAFIFGNEITDLALGHKAADPPLPGSTHQSGGAAIIWLLAISLGAPIAIISGIYSSPVPLSSAIRTPLSRHLKLISCTSIPWLCHIHIYGVCATTLLPEKVAAAIGWPMLMIVTTGQALIVSVYLGEWNMASEKTISILRWSLSVTGAGLGILMCSAAVPTS